MFFEIAKNKRGILNPSFLVLLSVYGSIQYNNGFNMSYLRGLRIEGILG
jgi:hypothetical protein